MRRSGVCAEPSNSGSRPRAGGEARGEFAGRGRLRQIAGTAELLLAEEAAGGQTQGAAEPGVVAEQGVGVERQVVGDERDVVADQGGDALSLSPVTAAGSLRQK
jgi:hypothetical protein